jgi:hypothetical protein
MNVLKLFPVVLSFLLLAAHFYRAGHLIITALCIGVLFLLFLRESWVPRMFQVLLILGALEWLRTLYSIASMRVAFEQDWTRLAVILGAVALLTALSGLVFKSEGVRARYRSLG